MAGNHSNSVSIVLLGCGNRHNPIRSCPNINIADLSPYLKILSIDDEYNYHYIIYADKKHTKKNVLFPNSLKKMFGY